jgi:DNA (cytosine-5)-methyltransferase 1
VAPTLNAFDQGDTRATIIALPAVRRLTPRECERLQGFPDDHTLVTYRGKNMSDSSRYRQMGNAVTVNVAAYIGALIMHAQENK